MVMCEFTKCLLWLMIGLWGLVRKFFSFKAQPKIKRKKPLDITSKNKEKTTTMTVFKHADVHIEQLSAFLNINKISSGMFPNSIYQLCWDKPWIWARLHYHYFLPKQSGNREEPTKVCFITQHLKVSQKMLSKLIGERSLRYIYTL